MRIFSQIHIFSFIFFCGFNIINVEETYAAIHPDGADVVFENIKSFEVHTKKLDVPLNLYVIIPENYDERMTYPVLYAFDADLSLGMMATFTSLVSRTARRSGLRPPIVVTLGYGDLTLALKRRLYDLTPFADEYNLPERPNGRKWGEVGGGDNFLDILIEDIKPFVEKKYSIDRSAETLYGHSLGGLLTLHALHTRSEHFERFAAASPSLWFNNGKTMNDLIAFHSSNISKQKIPLRLTIGGDEEELKGWSLRHGKNIEFRKKWISNNRMLSNAKLLQDELTSKSGNILLHFDIYSNLEHAIANAPAFYDALRFAIEPNK